MARHRLCAVEDVKVGANPFSVADRDVLVWCLAPGDYYGLHRWCSHMGEGLELGTLDEDEKKLVCHRHSVGFYLETGKTDSDLFASDISTYEVFAEDGDLFIEIP